MKVGSSCTPGVGLHAHGPFGFAVFDALLTVLASFLIAKLFHVSFWITALVLFVLGIIVHRVLKVNTALNVKIFGEL